MAKIVTFRVEPTIAQVLRKHLEQVSEKQRKNAAAILDLFEASMNSYAYQSLPKNEAKYFDNQFNNHDKQFCELFGPEKIPENVGEFLNYFLVRKVAAPKSMIAGAPGVIKHLLDWLEKEAFIKVGSRAHASGAAEEAHTTLPVAGKLGEMLYNHVRHQPLALGMVIRDDDVVESTFEIARVEGNTIWFSDWESVDEEYGVRLSDALVRQCKKAIGFTVWLQLGLLRSKKGDAWKILESGTVYPP